MQGQITSGANSIAQMATKAAMEADPEVIAPMIETFRKRRELVYTLLSEIPGLKLNKPEGAFYFFPDVSSYFGKRNGDDVIHNATDLSMYLLKTEHVAVVTGDAFGDADCIRISYATAEETLKEALKRIARGLATLK
jgi:aspartate aminotransferase